MSKPEDARERIYKSIIQSYRDYGVSPTMREIMYEARISSTSVVSYHLERLEKDGYITRSPTGHRVILVTGAIWLDPGAARAFENYKKMLRIEQEKYP